MGLNEGIEPSFDCDYEWPNTDARIDHQMHECAEGDRCWRKSIHECWCGATIWKSADGN